VHLQDVLERSAERRQVVLKHSTTCPVSSNALEEYNQYLQIILTNSEINRDFHRGAILINCGTIITEPRGFAGSDF
jgi:hypothetical protein